MRTGFGIIRLGLSVEARGSQQAIEDIRYSGVRKRVKMGQALLAAARVKLIRSNSLVKQRPKMRS